VGTAKANSFLHTLRDSCAARSRVCALFNQIGFGGHKARDIMFLSKDFVQILTYENCVEELAEKLTKAVPTARLVRDADPTDPSNYEEHGKLSREFLHTQYFTVMEGSVARFLRSWRLNVPSSPGHSQAKSVPHEQNNLC
jgi:hypothetical protein